MSRCLLIVGKLLSTGRETHLKFIKFSLIVTNFHSLNFGFDRKQVIKAFTIYLTKFTSLLVISITSFLAVFLWSDSRGRTLSLMADQLLR